MTPAPEITHKERVSIVDHLILESERKGPDKAKVFAREIKLVKQLYPRYPDLSFWLGINLGFQLHSLGWFKAEGAVELEAKWRYHKIISRQSPPAVPSPITLDNPVKSESMVHERVEQGSALQP
jgi:hypothetical protein